MKKQLYLRLHQAVNALEVHICWPSFSICDGGGSEPTISWCMFPMIGSFHGPGGNFGDLMDLHTRLATMNKKRSKLKWAEEDGI